MVTSRDDMRNHCVDVLIEMCERLDLDDISVTAFVQSAGISRQTFYKYFLDMNDLIGLAGVRPLLEGSGSILSFERSMQALNYAKHHPGFFTKLARRTHGQNNFKDSYIHWMSEKLGTLFVHGGLDPDECLHRQLQIRIYCAGFLDVIFMWFSQGMELPTEAIVRAVVAARPVFMVEESDASPETFPDYPQ